MMVTCVSLRGGRHSTTISNPPCSNTECRDRARAGPRRARRHTRTAARRWLLGELEDQVAVPVAVACAAVGVNPAALASVVRRTVTNHHEPRARSYWADVVVV